MPILLCHAPYLPIPKKVVTKWSQIKRSADAQINGMRKELLWIYSLIHTGTLPARNYCPDFYISCLAPDSSELLRWAIFSSKGYPIRLKRSQLRQAISWHEAERRKGDKDGKWLKQIKKAPRVLAEGHIFKGLTSFRFNTHTLLRCSHGPGMDCWTEIDRSQIWIATR